MKKLLTFIIIAAASLVAMPKAEARPCSSNYSGHSYVSGRTSCGCPVYSQRYVAYYDRCGRPVYSVRRLPVTHRCRHHRAKQSHGIYHRGHVQAHRYPRSVHSYRAYHHATRNRCR